MLNDSVCIFLPMPSEKTWIYLFLPSPPPGSYGKEIGQTAIFSFGKGLDLGERKQNSNPFY